MIQVVKGAEILPVLVKCIHEAQSSIWVAMFEWSWYPGRHTGSVQDINRALCIRASHGLAVRVLLHSEAMGRVLHKINVKTAQHLTKSGAEVRWGSSAKPLHAKVWIFDQRVVVAGSHNISARSVQVNQEMSVLLDEPDEVKRVVEWHEAMWARSIPPRH